MLIIISCDMLEVEDNNSSKDSNESVKKIHFFSKVKDISNAKKFVLYNEKNISIYEGILQSNGIGNVPNEIDISKAKRVELIFY